MEKERLVSLDAFRGLTIAAMILVNNPGDWGHVYWPLDHAEVGASPPSQDQKSSDWSQGDEQYRHLT